MSKLFVVVLAVIFPFSSLFAADYPEMVGTWKGNVRIAESGLTTEGEVAKGGIQISNVVMTVRIDAQDGETFVGKTRTTATPPDQPSPAVWGTIRSGGKEAIFLSENGARGQLWFKDATHFEFCVTSMNETVATAYCAELTKQ